MMRFGHILIAALCFTVSASAASAGPAAVTGIVPSLSATVIRAPCFTAPAFVVRVLDGDTFVATVPIWLNGLQATETIRVLGVDAPEMTGATKPAGEAAKAFAVEWLGAGQVELMACKRDSFGRALAEVRRPAQGGVPGERLADALIRSGHGVPR